MIHFCVILFSECHSHFSFHFLLFVFYRFLENNSINFISFTDKTFCVIYRIQQGDIDLCGGDPSDGMDSDCSGSSNPGKQVLVGICAMAKKTQSKPMKEILTRLREFEYIRMVVFEEDVILKDPVENWPICDCLISFHSKGFPLEKAIQYALLRKPYVINNLHMQYDIMVSTNRY